VMNCPGKHRYWSFTPTRSLISQRVWSPGPGMRRVADSMAEEYPGSFPRFCGTSLRLLAGISIGDESGGQYAHAVRH
jgi:hypothetical protein